MEKKSLTEKINEAQVLRAQYVRAALDLTENLLKLPTYPTKNEAYEVQKMYLEISKNTNITPKTVGVALGLSEVTIYQTLSACDKRKRQNCAKSTLTVLREYARQLRIFYGYY